MGALICHDLEFSSHCGNEERPVFLLNGAGTTECPLPHHVHKINLIGCKLKREGQNNEIYTRAL